MKKLLLTLTLLALYLPSLSANKYSWTGAYMKLLPAYSNLKLNYSGDERYTMPLSKKPAYNYDYPYYRDTGTIYTIAENVSTGAITLDPTCGISQEVSENFGLIAELGCSTGISSNFINSQRALIIQSYLAAGIFYHQPSFRISTMGGIGFGKDIFGYPNAVESLEKGETVNLYDNDNLINSTLGVTYRASVGFDYKLTPSLLLGVSYMYMRSKTIVELANEETFYISNHSLAAMIGIHM